MSSSRKTEKLHCTGVKFVILLDNQKSSGIFLEL